VNESQQRFAAVGSDIRFGLGAVRNIGDKVIDGIINARAEQGRYTDFNDFLRKVPAAVCNKRAIESLIKAGAFDSLGHERKALLTVHDQAVDSIIDVKRNEAIGQDSLFGGMDDDGGAAETFAIAIPPGEWDKTTLLAFEREMLGLYVSSHPLDGAERILERNRDHRVADILDGAGGNGNIKIAGIITGVDRKVTKQGNVWAIVKLEDHEAAIEIPCFPASYQLYQNALVQDSVVAITGRVRHQENNDDSTTISFVAQEVETLDVSAAQQHGQPPVVIAMREDKVTPELTSELKRILQAHPGDCPVHLRLTKPGGRKGLVLDLTRFSVDPSSSFMGDIKSLLGSAAIAI
jgi:DNA polymerase-3 subunit alpha